jgi:hypothetical protein
MMTLALLLVALSKAPGPGGGQTAKQPFEIEISATAETVDSGSGPAIIVLLKNTSDQPLDCSGNISDLTGQYANFGIDVRDEHGNAAAKRVYPHPELAEGSPILNCTIAPGGSWTLSQTVDRIYDFTRPGKYVIQVSRPISFTDPKAGVVKSNVITVTIVPPPFTIQISTPNPEVKAGTPIPLSVRLTNTSSAVLLFGGPPTATVDSHYAYACYNGAGGDVRRYSPVAPEDHPAIKLKPEEVLDQQVPISSACDLSQPGEYRIQLFRNDPRGPKQGFVRSNEITVTVKP